MSGHISRVGQRVDKISVTDDHDMYRKDGTPVLADSKVGRIVEKQVVSYTMYCPDCGIPAWFNSHSEPVCPECGLICDGGQGKSVIREEQMVRDPKAAGRMVDGDSHDSP